MTAISPNQWTILESLQDGPRWLRSFQTVKRLVEELVSQGLIERCRPHLGHGKNMARLTVAGCALLEIDPASVPKARAIEPPSPAKAPDLGAIKPGISDRCRSICKAFVRAVSLGEKPKDVAGQLAARYDVQRPAIWKALRVGGVVAPYQPRKEGGKGRPLGGGTPGYSEQRRARSIEVAAAKVPEIRRPMDREPCPRCGVRGDIGCKHSRVDVGAL